MDSDPSQGIIGFREIVFMYREAFVFLLICFVYGLSLEVYAL